MKANRLIAKAIRTVDELDKKNIHLNLFIGSHPGFGKTSTVRMYCDYMDYNLITIIPSQSASDDILGIQSVKDGKLVRLTPSWYNYMIDVMKNGKRTLLFIDEISTCDAYIQGPLLDLIFSHNLGEEHLPDNVFIVAAGNYPEDLNNEFRMSSPLINRFLLLNLANEDYSINEIINDTFNSLNTKEEIGKFLGLNDIGKEDFKPKYDYNKFTNWIKTDKEVIFGKTTIEEDPDFGILGFTSVRSLNYSLNYVKEYMATFEDNEWIRIVGDTLGVSNKRYTKNGDNGMPMRSVISSYQENFLADCLSSENESIIDVCTRMSRMGITDADIEKLSVMLDIMDPSELTSQDINAFSSLNASTTDKDWSNVKFMNLIDKFASMAKKAKMSKAFNNFKQEVKS